MHARLIPEPLGVSCLSILYVPPSAGVATFPSQIWKMERYKSFRDCRIGVPDTIPYICKNVDRKGTMKSDAPNFSHVMGGGHHPIERAEAS